MQRKHFELAPLILLCIFTGKLLVLNSWSYQEAIVLLGLAAVSSIFHLKAKNEDVTRLESMLAAHQTEIDFLKSQNDSVKATISGMKLAQSVKNAGRF